MDDLESKIYDITSPSALPFLLNWYLWAIPLVLILVALFYFSKRSPFKEKAQTLENAKAQLLKLIDQQPRSGSGIERAGIAIKRFLSLEFGEDLVGKSAFDLREKQRDGYFAKRALPADLLASLAECETVRFSGQKNQALEPYFSRIKDAIRKF